MRGIGDNAKAGERKPAFLRHRGGYVGFRINRPSARVGEQFALFLRIGDDVIDPENRRVHRIPGRLQKHLRPAVMRIDAARGCDHLGGDEVRSAAQPVIQSTGNSETDDPAAGGIVERAGHRGGGFMPTAAADRGASGYAGNARFEGESDNDQNERLKQNHCQGVREGRGWTGFYR